MLRPLPFISATSTPASIASPSSIAPSASLSTQIVPVSEARRTTPALAVVTALPLVTLIVRVEDTLLSLSCTPLRTIERSVAEKPQPSCAVKRTV